MVENNIRELKVHYKKLFDDALLELKTKGKSVRQIPNILTFMRILAPFFIIPAACFKNVKLICIFVIFFSFTDALDGFIARKWHFVSELGKDLDAVCDKVFAVTLLLAASFFEPVLILNFLLELAIASVNTKAKLRNYNPSSSLIGKAKTCFLYTLIGLGLLNDYMNISNLFVFMFLLTTIMQLATTISYVFKYREAREQELNVSKIKSNIE